MELLRHGADLDLQTSVNRETALHIAIRGRKAQAARFLIEAGANIKIKDLKNISCADLAIELDYTEVIWHMIREKG